MLPELPTHFSVSDPVAIGLGVVLLLLGRRLYWMALAGLGFLLGLWLAGHVLDLRSGWLELGLGLGAGLVCALLARVAQKIAIGIGGFVLGGAGGFWLASWFEPAAGAELGPWIWLAPLVGALLGVALARPLFEASLVAFSALAGALLITSRSHLGTTHETWVFLVLVLVGVIAQSRTDSRRRRRAG